MDRFNILTHTVLLRLDGLADWLYGCSHRKTTFPITLPGDIGLQRQQSGRPETYIVCVECGRHLAYDWTTMRTRTGKGACARAPVRSPVTNTSNYGRSLAVGLQSRTEQQTSTLDARSS